MTRVDKTNLFSGYSIVNQFKTSRTSTTNPFKYQDFEGNDVSFKGNTLQYADVFEGYKQPSFKGSKLKMITSTVAGSVTKIRNGITEPIINFAKGVASRVSSAWQYAKNLTDIPSIKTVKEHYENSILSKDIIEIGKDISHSISNASSKIKMPDINLGLTDSIKDTWSSFVNKIHPKKISSETPVAELKSMLVKALAEDGKKVA